MNALHLYIEQTIRVGCDACGAMNQIAQAPLVLQLDGAKLFDGAFIMRMVSESFDLPRFGTPLPTNF